MIGGIAQKPSSKHKAGFFLKKGTRAATADPQTMYRDVRLETGALGDKPVNPGLRARGSSAIYVDSRHRIAPCQGCRMKEKKKKRGVDDVTTKDIEFCLVCRTKDDMGMD